MSRLTTAIAASLIGTALALGVPGPVSAQTGSNSFRGLYEANVVPNAKDIVFLVTQNNRASCILVSYSARRSSSALFAINAAGQFSFVVGGESVTGTFTTSGVTGNDNGTAFSTSRTPLDNRNNNFAGGYSGWVWDTSNGNLGIMNWIISPTGKNYVEFDLGGSSDGGTGTTTAAGTFNFKSVVDGFIYENAASSGDGHLVLSNGVLGGSFVASPTAFGLVSLTKENVTNHLINIATRGTVGTGDGVLIAGFVISGGAKRVIIRALGPSLTAAGVTGALSDPTLEIVKNGTQLLFNDNWASGTAAAEVQAAGLAPTNAKESAVAISLEPGSYTAIVRGAGSATGIGLVEVYELD